MRIEPYIHFNGRCEEAIEFYKKTLGAQVQMLHRFNDMPAGTPSMVRPEDQNKVMHATVQIGETTVLMSDGRGPEGAEFEGFSLSIRVPGEAEGRQLFNALSEGGNVTMPMTKTFFSPAFGMLTNRYGISWMVHVGK